MVAIPQQTKSPSDFRGILLERRKTSHGWPKCLCKTPPKVVLCNNNLYTNPIEKHQYEEPEEKDDSICQYAERR